MRSWRSDGVDTVFSHRLFALERHRLARDEQGREVMVLRAPDWVNVIAIDEESRVLLVRQWRFGLQEPTLEIPGGMVEGEPHREAAARELLEETGYRARRWRRVGEVHPNPAFLSNRCSTWLATELEWCGPAAGDGDEEIELSRVPLETIPALIRKGTITHSLVIAAFYLLELEE